MASGCAKQGERGFERPGEPVAVELAAALAAQGLTQQGLRSVAAAGQQLGVREMAAELEAGDDARQSRELIGILLAARCREQMGQPGIAEVV